MTTVTATTLPTTAASTIPSTADVRRLAAARAALGVALAGLDRDDPGSRGLIAAAIEQVGGQPDRDAPAVVLTRQFAVLARRAVRDVPDDVAGAIHATEALAEFAAAVASRGTTGEDAAAERRPTP